MSAAEMREAAARLAMSKLEAMGLRGTGHIVGEAILGLPLPDAAEKPQEAADWSDLPRDMYVVRAWKPDGMFWCAEVAQVPHALAPEVRYVRALPLPDEEGMVERVARAMCFAWHYAKPRTPDGEAEWARERSRLMAQARAALHVINGGAEGGEARQHIEALLSLHIAHHNNPIHGAARAFLSKREAK